MFKPFKNFMKPNKLRQLSILHDLLYQKDITIDYLTDAYKISVLQLHRDLQQLRTAGIGVHSSRRYVEVFGLAEEKRRLKNSLTLFFKFHYTEIE